MANSNNSTRFLSVASGHIDSLINYVLDVKPYHTKLSEIVEEFLFEDHLNVKIKDKNKELVVLGNDLLNKSLNGNLKVWEGIGASRPLESLSAERTIISDGVRKTFPIPTTVINKLLSQSSQERHVVGVDDDTQIVGLPRGVLSTRRYDGWGIPNVLLNGVSMAESVDYHVSHGAFSFNTYANTKWKATDIKDNADFPKMNGELMIRDVFETFGTISNITTTKYEEFTLQWIAGANALKVVGSVSGNLGSCAFNQTFTHPFLTFTFREVDSSPPGTFPPISNGDTFLLTPSNKITIHPTAPQETWTLIKTNPQALVATPEFYRESNTFAFDGFSQQEASISVFTHSLEWTPESTWTITFTSPDDFIVSVAGSVSGYPRTGSGTSYKDEFIHFNVVPPQGGFQENDTFTFSVKAKKANYLVFGSVSGWQPSAFIGEWYWNGKIGFKIPALDYYAIRRSASISTSTDLITWDPVVVSGQELTTLEYVNNVFMAAGAHSIVATSTNGTHWTDDMTSFAQVDNRLIVIGENGFIAQTEDGIDWLQVASHTTNYLRGIDVIPTVTADEAATDNLMVVVGDNGTIITSLNGLGWTTRNSGVTVHLNGVAHDSNWIVAVGNDGTIIRSQDRINWIPCVSPTTNKLNRVKYLNGKFFAVGEHGTILKSNDGVTWTQMVSNTDRELNDIAFGLNTYVAVGRGAVTCISYDTIYWTANVSRSINSIVFGEEEELFIVVEHEVQTVANVTPLLPIHSVASPSVYSAIFRTPVTGTTVVGGTIKHNITGYGKGFKTDIPWFDEHTGFIISQADNPYNPGERIDIYLVPKSHFASVPGRVDFPVDFLQEYFPLFHNHDSLIFQDVEDGDEVIIDKVETDSIKFKIGNGETPPPALAAEAGWIPLEWRYDTASPMMATHFDAYLASDYETKVLSITQSLIGGKPGLATLTFDDAFFNQFLPERKYFSLRFKQADTYGQTINVKVSENIRVFARVRLNFAEILNLEIPDHIQPWHAAVFIEDEFSVHFEEGGMFSRIGYDTLPYDIIPYDLSYYTEQIMGLAEVPPGSGNYVYTGNPSDIVVVATKVDDPAITVNDKVGEHPMTSFAEGLQIVVTNPDSGSTPPSTTVTAFDTTHDDFAYAGTSVIFNPDRNEIWAGMNSTYDGFSRMDPETGAQIGYIAVTAAGTTGIETDLLYPAYDAVNKKIYVGNYSVRALLQFDAPTATFNKRIAWPDMQWFGVHPTTGNLWATIGVTGSGRLQSKNPTTEVVLVDVPLSTANAGEILFDNDGNVWVAEDNFGAPVLCQYNQSGTLLYTHSEPDGLLHMRYDKDRNSIWYGTGQVAAASTAGITNITLGNPTIVTFNPFSGPGFVTGQRVRVSGINGGNHQLNYHSYICTVIDANNVSLAVDSTAFDAYTSSGEIRNSPRRVKELRVATKTIDKVLDITSQSYSFSQDFLYDSPRGVLWVLSNWTEDSLMGFDTTTGALRYTANMPDWNPFRATLAANGDVWVNEDNYESVMRARFIDGTSGSGGPAISVSVMYDVNSSEIVKVNTEASEYVVTHNYTGGTPTVIIDPDAGAPFTVTPIPIYTPSPGAQTGSFKITVPSGNVPFKLTLS